MEDILKIIDVRILEATEDIKEADNQDDIFADSYLIEQLRALRILISRVKLPVKPEIADIEFLVNRSMKAGTCNFSGDRDTGTSSNSIVAIAYGLKTLDEQILPSDMSDLMACRNMWEQLPEHRKSESAKIAMEKAEDFR